MPVEIKELVIRAIVDAGPKGGPSTSGPSAQAGRDDEALIRECVRQVLRILEKKKER